MQVSLTILYVISSINYHASSTTFEQDEQEVDYDKTGLDPLPTSGSHQLSDIAPILPRKKTLWILLISDTTQHYGYNDYA